jgi:hypothetical protein
MNKWELSRRQLLRDLGLGAACLPLLNASVSKAADVKKNLFIVAATEGYRASNWQPADGALTGPLPKSCVALEKHKADLIFLHTMANKAFTGCGACGHGAYGTAYYTLAPKGGTGEYAEPNGATLDQVIAKSLGSDSGRISFHAATQIQLPPSNGGPGHNHAFWTGAGQPINPELDPYKTYADMFGGAKPAAPGMPVDDTAAKAMLARKQSILDFVKGSLDRFKMRLGTDDRAIVDGHFSSIRELEQQLMSAGTINTGACASMPPGMISITDNTQYEKIYDAYIDIMISAIRCGVTHVATLQLADATGDSVNFGAYVPGVPAKGTGYKTAFRNWHDLGHNPVLGGVDHKQIVDQWWMAKLSVMIDKLKASPGVGGAATLFDSSVVLWGNHMHEGSDHGSQAIPWLLASGGGAGYFKTGQCVGGGNTAMVAADLCNAMGATMHPFGSGNPALKK